MITIPNFLSEEYCDHLVAVLDGIGWHDGTTFDPEYKEKVKKNLELGEKDNPVIADNGKKILEAIFGSAELRDQIFFYKCKTPQFNKYTEEGEYNWHSDSTFMGSPEIRTDLAITIFLNSPDDYKGGQLILKYPTGEEKHVKEDKGTLVCYPCGLLHKVTPVDGVRYAAVTWVQSLVRSSEKRDILINLNSLISQIRDEEGISDKYNKIFNVKANLLRMWSEI